MDQDIATLVSVGGGSLVALATLFYGVLAGMLEKHVEQTVAKTSQALLGKGDPTPKHVQDRDTGAFALIVRAELEHQLEPIKEEQTRQGRKQDEQGQKLEILARGHERLKRRQREMSAEIAQGKSKAEIHALTELVDEDD